MSNLAAADLLMYSRGDPETTARVIDSALADELDAAGILLLRAKILRAEAAHALGDDGLATRLLGEVAGVALEAGERSGIVDELARAGELRSAIG